MLSANLKDREFDKFQLDADDNTAVNVLFTGGSFAAPNEADTITTEYPSSLIEIYRFREGGLAGTILKSIRITYEDSCKNRLASAEVL